VGEGEDKGGDEGEGEGEIFKMRVLGCSSVCCGCG
jgi:hypothetical protein